MAADLHTTASGYQSVISGLTDESWLGPVPPSWAEALSVRPMTLAGAMALPGAHLGAAPVAASGAGVSKLPMAGMVGREADGVVQRVGFRSSVIPHSPMAG